MSETIFKNLPMLMLLPIVVVFIVVFRVRMLKRKQDMRAFGEDAAWRGTAHRSMELWRLLLLVTATLLIILALTRPAVNPHPKMLQREGRDVVFLLDVSNSMMAEDRLPNRLTSAKLAISECVSDLQGHRVGLVVFAGSSSIACPLTVDKEFFLNSLERVGPGSVAHGGTRIGDALLKVCDKIFADSDQGYKDIVLLTDGGDHSESLTKALEIINEKQVKLIAIGLGDETKGARIPQVGTKSDYMVYKGQEVWTKLDTLQLSQMTKAVDQGAFLAVGTRQMKLGDIYQRISEQADKQQMAEESVITYDEIFQILIAAALVLLVVMILVPHTLSRRLKTPAVAVAMLFFGMMQTAPAQIDSADQAFEKGQYQQALEMYEVSSTHSDDARVWYKKGNAQYRLKHFAEAILSYENALQHQPSGTLIRDITYNLGNAYFKESERAEDLYVSLSMVNQSVMMYRRVILQSPADHDAAVNMELTKIERRALQQKIAEEEKRRQEMKAALNQLRSLLESAIVAQGINLKMTDDAIAKDRTEFFQQRALQEKEAAIFKTTDEVIQLAAATRDKFFRDIPAEFNPLKETSEHLSLAYQQELLALDYMIPLPADASFYEQLALGELRAALDALPRDPDSADDEAGEGEEGDEESEGEEGESDGEGEEGDEESDSEGTEDGEADPSDTNEMNLENMDIPPPNDSAEDVIRKSAAQQEARQSEVAKKKGKPVEKDW